MKYQHSFDTALDKDSRADGKIKRTNATIDFEGVTEENLHHLAIKQAVIKHQARMRKHWEQHQSNANVTIMVRDLLTRLAGVRVVTFDGAVAAVESFTDEQKLALREKLNEMLGETE